MLKRNRVGIGVAALAASLLAACMPPPMIQSTQQVQYGYVENDNVDIVAVDGSFTLSSHRDFQVPFQVDVYGRENAMVFNQCLAGQRQAFICGNVDLLDPVTMQNLGARQVKVKVSGKRDLYGLLLLTRPFDPAYTPYRAWMTSYSAAIRNYSLKIPQSVIDGALDGRTTVAYEVFAAYDGANAPAGLRGRTLKSWTLTLSRLPFPTVAPSPVADSSAASAATQNCAPVTMGSAFGAALLGQTAQLVRASANCNGSR